MLRTAPKELVRRSHILWNVHFNLPRSEMHLNSTDTAGVALFMSEQPAKYGTDIRGWNEDRPVGAMRLSEKENEVVIKSNHPVDKDTGKTLSFVVKGGHDSVIGLIDYEMMHRRDSHSRLLKAGGIELEAFQQEFCDENGELIDLHEIPLSELFLGIEGHHRGMRSYFDAHVLCLKAEPPKAFSNEIPVIPTIFSDIDELMNFQARGNASDGKQNRLTKLDYVKIAIQQFLRLSSSNAFSKMMGEASPRRSSGQGGDEPKTEGAGSMAVFAWNVAELHHRFPRLNVWGCLNKPKKDRDHVALSDLATSPKPDWKKSVPVVLQLSDRKKLDDYMNKFSDKAIPIVRETWEGKRPLWTEEDVVVWWEGRKADPTTGKVDSAIEDQPKVTSSLVENWSNAGPNRVARMTAKALLYPNGEEANILHNPQFNELINAAALAAQANYAEKVSQLLTKLHDLSTVPTVNFPLVLEDIESLLNSQFKKEAATAPAEAEVTTPKKAKSK